MSRKDSTDWNIVSQSRLPLLQSSEQSQKIVSAGQDRKMRIRQFFLFLSKPGPVAVLLAPGTPESHSSPCSLVISGSVFGSAHIPPTPHPPADTHHELLEGP